MIDKNVITARVEAYLQDTNNYLIDVTVTPAGTITVEIDSDSGVDIDTCAALSRHLESGLDRDTEDFELTVTSAGLTSPFKTLRQYQKYTGQEVEVLTAGGEKLKGTLREATPEGFTLTVTRRVKPEGAKRKTDVQEDRFLVYDAVKYTKYLIRFN